MLKISDLTITYAGSEAPVIENLSFQLPAGSFCLLHGRSGTGKTTLCLALAGLLSHASPESHIVGDIAWNISERNNNNPFSPIAITLENPYSQLSDLKNTVEGEIAFGLEMQGVPPSEIRPLITEAGSIFGISHLMYRNPRTLSGGETQKVIIACSYVLSPRLWILDRPLTELDAAARVDFLRTLKSLADGNEATIIISEEPYPDIVAFATHQLSLDNGTLQVNTSSHRNMSKENAYPSSIQFQKASLDRDVSSAPLTRGMVKVKDLSYRYSQDSPAILENINIIVCPGECLWISGPNGCGKTTLAKLLMGILKPQKGEVIINGFKTGTAPLWETARHISFAFQNPDYQIFSTTIWEEVTFGPKSLGYSHEKCEALTDDALNLFGLLNKKKSHPHDLNRSEKKRLGLASVFSMDTPVLILDEPTQYQDAEGKRLVENAILDVLAKEKCVLCISHDPLILNNLGFAPLPKHINS